MSSSQRTLNYDVGLQVLSYLNPTDLSHAGATCRFWRSISQHPGLWENFITNSRTERSIKQPARSPHTQFLVEKAWDSGTAVPSFSPVPSEPFHICVSGIGRGFFVASAPAPTHHPNALGQTPLTIYRRDPANENALEAESFLAVQHHKGGQPKLLKLRNGAEDGVIYAAYGYLDGTISCYKVSSTDWGQESRGENQTARLVFRSAAAREDCITCIDVSEYGTIYVGTSRGAVLVIRGAESARALVASCQIVSIRSGSSVGSGLVGTFDGQVLSFNACLPHVVTGLYIGPSGHPVGTVEYGESRGLVSATYLGNNGSSPPVAIGWDARSTRRINSSFQTDRLRRRRGANMHQDIASGGMDFQGGDNKIALLLAGGVLVYDIRKWNVCAEVGDDAISVACKGDYLAVGQSPSRSLYGQVSKERSLTCLDFAAAAKRPAESVHRYQEELTSERFIHRNGGSATRATLQGTPCVPFPDQELHEALSLQGE